MIVSTCSSGPRALSGPRQRTIFPSSYSSISFPPPSNSDSGRVPSHSFTASRSSSSSGIFSPNGPTSPCSSIEKCGKRIGYSAERFHARPFRRSTLRVLIIHRTRLQYPRENPMTAMPILTLLQADPRSSWLPVVLLIVIGVGFAIGNIVLSLILGPKRTGPGKSITYESGMVPIGDARRRFNVRFYLVAMIFLVFDVEIVFFYPWAALFSAAVADPDHFGFATRLLVSMLIFIVILLVAYFYAWGKGVFRWD